MELPDKTQSLQAVPKKQIKQVVSGATVAPRPATRRFFDFLFADSPKVLAQRVTSNVLVPRAKAALEEGLNSFISGMFWGESQNRPMSNVVHGTVLRGNAVNYAGISHGMDPLQAARAAAASTTSVGTYQDLVVPTQQQAEILLANMYDTYNQYRVVAVGDLYEMAGITPSPADNAYGWTSLDGARISKQRNGFVLELPRPTLI